MGYVWICDLSFLKGLNRTNSNSVQFCCFKGVFTSSLREKGIFLIFTRDNKHIFGRLFSGFNKAHFLCFVVLQDNFKGLLASSG